MSDRPKQLHPFEKAMMEMYAQEKPKECNHHWRYFSFGTKVCSKCNEFIENVPNFSQYHEPTEEGFSRCIFRKPNTYTKEKHFNDTLDIFIEYKNPKESVMEFTRSLPNNITKAEIRQEIKRQRKTGLARFLRTGIEPKPARWEDEAGVRRDFTEQEDELTKLLGERKNSIHVSYKLYKLFQHNGVDVDIEDFPLPKPKKLKEYKEIMEKVWEILGWEWVKV